MVEVVGITSEGEAVTAVELPTGITIPVVETIINKAPAPDPVVRPGNDSLLSFPRVPA